MRYLAYFVFVFSLMLFVFSAVIYYFFAVPLDSYEIQASVFIDFDNYMCSMCKTKKISLLHSFRYHERLKKLEKENKERGIREKGDFHIFHTIEFHILVGLLGFLWIGFFYIFIGMTFHSLLDIISLLYDDFMYIREFSLIRWLWLRRV